MPHIGPLVPPAAPAKAEPTFTKNVPIDERSMSPSSWRSTARKPSARVLPKSASPISPSKSQKYFSLSSDTFATVRRQLSTVSKLRLFIPGGVVCWFLAAKTPHTAAYPQVSEPRWKQQRALLVKLLTGANSPEAR